MWLDIKHSVRTLAKTPGFTAIALLVIAAGIGATASMFSVVNAVLLRSLPYEHPEQLVYLFSPNRNFKGVPLELGPNVPDVYARQRASHSFRSIALMMPVGVNVSGNGGALRAQATFVSGGFFRTLELRAAAGRTIDANDDQPGREHVAVLSDTFSRSHFGRVRNAIGKQIEINRQKYTVIGVMPKDFGYPYDGDIPYERLEFKQTDIWLPSAYTAAEKSNRENFKSADAIGRLRNGVSAAQAEVELQAIEERLQPLYPERWRGWSVLVRPLVATIIGPVEKMLWLLLGAVGFVLLIAISNVTNLLVARTMGRAHELAIRSALGAERRRILVQLVTESLLLCLAGGAFGVALAYAGVRILRISDPGNIPRFADASVDGRVLVVAVVLSVVCGVLSVVCGVLAGAVPGMWMSRAGVSELLRRGGNRVRGGSHSARFALVALEVALSIVLLTGAALLIRSYLALRAVQPGFSRATLTFRVDLDERYNTPELQNAFYRTFLEKLSSLPGVKYAGASTALPLSGTESVTFAEIRGFGMSKEMLEVRSVTPDYRKALGTPLLRGRDFDTRDENAKPPVPIVNERFARTYFKDRNPIGGQVRIGIGDLSKTPWATVVGVVGDIRHNALEQAAEPQIWGPSIGGNYAVSYSGPEEAVVAEARRALRLLDPALSLQDVRTMRERIVGANARRTFETVLLTGFAAVALLLALSGLYGLISYTVKQRDAEIGIRLAVGSSPGQIVGLILSQGLRTAAWGVAMELMCAFAVTRLIASWLFGVEPFDPLAFALAAAVMLVVAALACVVPASSAARVDPIQALQRE